MNIYSDIEYKLNISQILASVKGEYEIFKVLRRLELASI